jgi:hypothetical protein
MVAVLKRRRPTQPRRRAAPRVELRELRIELAELRIANTELRQMLAAAHVSELPNPLRSHRVNCSHRVN